MTSCFGRSSGGGPPPGSRPLNGISENGTPKMSTYSAVSSPVCRVRRVVHPPQSAPHHLLAKQLTVKRSQAKNVRHVVRVPAFAEHVHADDTADVPAGFARLAHGRDDLPQFLRRFLLSGVRVFALGCSEQFGVDAQRYFRALPVPKFGEARQPRPVVFLRLRLLLPRFGVSSSSSSSSSGTSASMSSSPEIAR